MPRAPRLLLLLVPAIAFAAFTSFASFAAFGATAARADTVTLPAGSGLPWSDPQHQGPLEQLAGRIATRIAGRPVSVRCEGDTDWLKLTTDRGVDPKRPGKRRTVVRTVWKTVQAPTAVTSEQPGPAVPCYVDGPGRAARFAVELSHAEVRAYETTAEAILTLAHEAVHLGGAVGGTTTSGLPYGDPLAEARAECSGMQWMAYVAQQLGGGAADAVAIAQFQARWRYPLRNTPVNAAEYWSADCVAGGALDSRTDRAAPWPSGLG